MNVEPIWQPVLLEEESAVTSHREPGEEFLFYRSVAAGLRACLKTFDKNGGVGDNRKKQAGAGENASIPK